MADRAARVREVRGQLIETRPEIVPVAVGLEEGEALRGVVREGARTTPEAGLGWGVGTLFVLEGLLATADDPLHVAANPFQHTGLAGPHHALGRRARRAGGRTRSSAGAISRVS